jgi:hypothetical protein
MACHAQYTVCRRWKEEGKHKNAYRNQQVTGNIYSVTRTMPLRITLLLKHDAASLGNRFSTFRRNTVPSKCGEQANNKTESRFTQVESSITPA